MLRRAADVPDVTATLTDADADVAITQAPNVNDTAKVIITAEDGTTELKYMVIFSVAPEFTSPQAAAPAPPAGPSQEDLLAEIRDLLKK